jgi:hypothetical protein
MIPEATAHTEPKSCAATTIVPCDDRSSVASATYAAGSSDECRTAGLHRLQGKFPLWEDESVGLVYKSLDRWEERKHEIMKLYLSENRTLKETRNIMRERGFEARRVQTYHYIIAIDLSNKVKHSEKVYKSYFKRWNLIKNKPRQKPERIVVDRTRPRTAHSGTLAFFLPSEKAPESSTTTEKADTDKCVSTRHCAAPKSLSSDAPQPLYNSFQKQIPTPDDIRLVELLSYCMKSNDELPRVHGKEIYQVSNDLSMAHVLCLRGLPQLSGTYWRSAFRSIHRLTENTSEPNLLVLLTTQVMCANRDLALETWKYLTAYARTRPETSDSTRRLFQELYVYLKTRSFESYLDLVADRIGTELRREQRYASERFPFFPTHYLESARKDLHKATSSREYNVMAHFRLSLQDNIVSLSQDARSILIADGWNLLIKLHAIGDATGWTHESVLHCATDLLNRALGLGCDGTYFEIAATAAIAAIHRANWDGLATRGDPRHSLAIRYLEGSVDAAFGQQRYMGSSFIENLEILEQWYREVGDIEMAEATLLRQQDWFKSHFNRDDEIY